MSKIDDVRKSSLAKEAIEPEDTSDEKQAKAGVSRETKLKEIHRFCDSLK